VAASVQIAFAAGTSVSAPATAFTTKSLTEILRGEAALISLRRASNRSTRQSAVM